MRNQLLIAIPFNATEAEIEAAHAAIDLHFQDGVNAEAGTGQPQQSTPAQTTNSTPAQTTGLQLDGDGLPWDERIHSSNKKMTDKGKWVARRNVPEATRAAVIAEIRATMGNQQPANTTPPNNAAPGLGAPGSSGLSLPGATGGLPSLPGASTVDPRYTHLVNFIGRNTKSDANPAGVIEAAWLTQVLTHFGVTDGSLQTLAHNLARIDEITAYITQTVLAGGGVQ